MTVTLDCPGCPLETAEIESLWAAARTQQHAPEGALGLRCVDETESQRLNRQYHGIDAPTNVLTFTYPATPELSQKKPSHDIALCLPRVRREAQARGLALRDYAAAVITHAFVHAVGLDHEHSKKEAARMTEVERQVLQMAGFNPEAIL